ncbi:MAG TPA: 4Fe-4S binding protein [Deferrisomatales bacterium]|nr:4Fe-4S binding protein [Deferrisomatales bacterium]
MIPIAGLATIAERAGAPLLGATPVTALPRNREEIDRILPGARHLVVLGAPHGRAALASDNVQVAQFDTRYTYDVVSAASHSLVRWLERAGHRTVAVPAFLPMDMAPPRNGMRGAVDWREAGVQAGLGGRGDCGLLVTAVYGTAVRLGGLVVDAEVETTAPLAENPCTGCGACVAACPAGALTGDGRLDKKKCGDRVFTGGFRSWRGFLEELAEAPAPQRQALLGSQQALDLWQNFMTGIYYTCWECQASCPVGRAPVPSPKPHPPGATTAPGPAGPT